MGGLIGAAAGAVGNAFGPSSQNTADMQGQLNTMQQTYQQSEQFEAAVTSLKTAGDAKMDAAKQRPQFG